MSMHGARRVPSGADVVVHRQEQTAMTTPEPGAGAAAVLALLATAVKGVCVVIAIGALLPGVARRAVSTTTVR